MADEETFLDLAAAERHAWAASEYDGQCVTCALVNALRWSREDADEGDQIRSKMSTLLSRTAVALNGPEPELTMWSWHDLPEKAQAAMDAIARARAVEPENAATSSRDYGRGYAQATRTSGVPSTGSVSIHGRVCVSMDQSSRSAYPGAHAFRTPGVPCR